MTHEAEAIGLLMLTFPDAYICTKDDPVGVFYKEVSELLLIFR